MLIPAAERRIWLCVAPTDMRRSFDGLAALARNHLGEDPTDGSWFVYVNRRRTIAKVLSFDGRGYWVWSKRLEAGRFGSRGARRPQAGAGPDRAAGAAGGRGHGREGTAQTLPQGGLSSFRKVREGRNLR